MSFPLLTGLLTLSLLLADKHCVPAVAQTVSPPTIAASVPTPRLLTSAEQTARYLPQLKGKRIGVMVNQTSRGGRSHLVDTLTAQGITVSAIV
jgi:hypothetical protein